MQPPAPPKPLAPSFRLKDDSDLFGLGLEEPGRKDSSEEGSCLGAPTPSCQAPADLALALNPGLQSRGEGATGRPPRGQKPCPQPCRLFSDHSQFPRLLTCGHIGGLCWRGQWAGALPSPRQREGLVSGPGGGPTASGSPGPGIILASSGPLEPRSSSGASLGLPHPRSGEERTPVCRSSLGPTQTQGRGGRAGCWLTLGTRGPWLRQDLRTPGLTQAALPCQAWQPRVGPASGRGANAASPLQIRRAGPPRRRRRRRRRRAKRYPCPKPPGALGQPCLPPR